MDKLTKDLLKITAEVLIEYHGYVKDTIISQFKQNYRFLLFPSQVLKGIFVTMVSQKDYVQKIPDLILDKLGILITDHLREVLNAQQNMSPSTNKLVQIATSEQIAKEALIEILKSLPKEDLPQC